MPELAEVEFMRRRWDAGLGGVIVAVDVHPRARVFRGCDVALLKRALAGAVFTTGARSGKQMGFRFAGAGWLGLHLGMTGELRVEAPRFVPGRHDHLVLRQDARALVFHDPRMFGAVAFDAGAGEPAWWRDRPPEIVDRAFTPAVVATFLRRRARSPLKAVLLMQERFPGVGNWMADEVLWRAGLHPARAAGALDADEVARLHRELRFVCRGALRSIVRGGRDGSWGDPPRGWLFHQRWAEGGRCPRSGVALVRETIGGRTTCWSPAVQRPAGGSS
jgi:formamidopyrimidine-DNA glycosylase